MRSTSLLLGAAVVAIAAPTTSSAPQALEALPPGVILGWYADAPPPDGFVPCDGTDGLPDLVDRVPMGTDDPRLVGERVGGARHTHTVTRLTTDAPRSGGWSDGWHAQGMNQLGTPQTTGLNHRHAITSGQVDEASSLPPSTRVMFICRR